MVKAVFLDRDGVINRKAAEGQYITCWEEFQFLPKVPEAIVALNRLKYSVIIVSNQRCVAKGLLTVEVLDKIHRRMLEHLSAFDAHVKAVYYCPHDTHDRCSCRKPAPGLLLQASRDHAIDLSRSWMVGDSDTDVQVGKSAGCKTVRIVGTGTTAPAIGADISVPSLFEAVEPLISENSRWRGQG